MPHLDLVNLILRRENEMQNPSRLDKEHIFRFECNPGSPCYTKCCRDVTIALTPYDVVRIKKALNIDSDSFIENYTILLPKPKKLIPLVILKMQKDDKKCPFVTPEGCSIYDDRPWACRMYPLDINDDGTYRIIGKSNECLGLFSPKQYKIEDWLVTQGVAAYDEMSKLVSQVILPLTVYEHEITNPQIAKMIFMSLYNLDKFREFVFNSKFLEKLTVSENRINDIKTDDIALLEFAIDWIKFGIFGEKTFFVKKDQ